MNGISCLMSKSFCPMYNLGTSKKIDLIPRRLLNLRLQKSSPRVTTTRLLKHRVYSSYTSKDVTGSRSQVPEVGSTSVPYRLLGFLDTSVPYVLAGLVVLGIVNPSAGYYIFRGFAVVVVAITFIWIMKVWDELSDNSYSNGDIIEVEDSSGEILSGQVIKKGVITTSLLTSDNRRVQLSRLWFMGKIIRNESQNFTRMPHSILLRKDSVLDESVAPWNVVVLKAFVRIEKIEKIPELIEEIMNMMKSNSNVLLEKEPPYCYRSKVNKYQVVLSLGCNLKPMSEEESYSVKQDIFEQSYQIIKKDRAT